MRPFTASAILASTLLVARASQAQPAEAPDPAHAPDDAPPPEGAVARATRRPPHARMFSASDDRAERERMRTPAARRRVAGQPEVLELPGMPDAYFFRSSVAGRARVYVYLHARNADPRESCRQFAAVVPRFGWLVCPVGPGIGADGHRQWNNNPVVARQYATTAVNALFQRFPRRARATDNVLMGFSEGAFVALQTGLNEPVMFPRWVIFAAHDRYIATEGDALANARHAVRKVYLITGAHDEIVEHSRRAAASLRHEHIGRVELRILPGVGHQLPPDFVATVRAALRWVTR